MSKRNFENVDAFKAKLDFQRTKLTGDKGIRRGQNGKSTLSHSVSSHNLPNKDINFDKNQEQYFNNININVNNLIINNASIPSNLAHPSSNINNGSSSNNNNNSNSNSNNTNSNCNYEDYRINYNNIIGGGSGNNNNNSGSGSGNSSNLNLGSVFSKIGSDIIGKTQSYKKGGVSVNKYHLKITNKNLNNPNMKPKSFGSGVEIVIDNLMDINKEKENKMKNNNWNINNSSPSKPPGQPNNQILDNIEETLETHSQIWWGLFQIELHVDNKINLHSILKQYLNYITERVLVENFSFEIFTVQALNSAYWKLLKISFVFIIYLKFILLDYNYEMTLKSNVKKMINSINENLYMLLINEIFVSGDRDWTSNKGCTWMKKDFIDYYNKINKIHKHKHAKEQGNFGNWMFKNLDIVINTIRQFSNNFFKIGYFKWIHTICFEIFRLIETYSVGDVVKTTMLNVLYYLNHKNNYEKKQSSSLVGAPMNSWASLGFFNVNPPFLPGVPDNVYTLVLDLDETLTHFFYTPSGGTFLIRPGCFEFLREMSTMYEWVIFTAAMKDYADTILNILDPTGSMIKYRLYRHHTSILGMSFVKDLSKLGRDLNKVLIIDNLPDNFKLQQNNGLPIKTWTEDMKDTEWTDIGLFLKEMYKKRPTDIRNYVRHFKEEINKRVRKNMLNPYWGVDWTKILA